MEADDEKPLCHGQYIYPLSFCEHLDHGALTECDTCGAAYCRLCGPEECEGPST